MINFSNNVALKKSRYLPGGILLLSAILGWVVYYNLILCFFREQPDSNSAIISVSNWITGEFVIIYESHKGLIDMLLSTTTLLFFTAAYVLMKRKRCNLLSFTSYLLTFWGFLLAVIPSSIFLAIAFLMIFISFKQWRNLLLFEYIPDSLESTKLISVSDKTCSYNDYFYYFRNYNKLMWFVKVN